MKHIEDAAIIIGVWGEGTIRFGHNLIIWNEGNEHRLAADSYDHVANVALKRIHQHNLKCYREQHPNEKLPRYLTHPEERKAD